MPPRFTLWHARNTRSLRILWTLEELGLKRGRDYALHNLRFPPREHHPEFLSANPLGTVPWFEHKEIFDNMPRAAMSESCAVPLYLAELLRSPLAIRVNDGNNYGHFLNWIAHADATLTFPQAVVMRYKLFEPGRAEAAADDYSKWFIARLRLLNAALEDGRSFLVGDRFTIADVCITYALFNASEDGLCGGPLVEKGLPALSARFKPQTADYLARMTQRPGWIQAMRVQDEAAAATELSCGAADALSE